MSDPGSGPNDEQADQEPPPRANESRTPSAGTCPFCLEEVNPQARRCMHCGSDLAGPVLLDPADDRVVYVVDRSIVRFTKYTAAVFGFLAIAGIWVLGIDLKRTVQDIDGIRRQVEDQGDTVASEALAVTAAGKEVVATLDDVRAKAEEVDQTLLGVRSLRSSAQADADTAQRSLQLILELEGKALRTTETLSLRDGVATVRTSVAVAPAADAESEFRLWAPGRTLRMAFLGGTPAEHGAIKAVAAQWSQHANIHFSFDGTPDAEIRISFKDGRGSWSYIGTDALTYSSADQATMNYGWSILDEPDTILHNFGHALGLSHEHQSPFGGLVWDDEAVYEMWGGPPNFWDRPVIFHNILRKIDPSKYKIEKPFDRHSIMLYSFGAGLLAQPFENGITPAPGLSRGDIDYIGKLYPH